MKESASRRPLFEVRHSPVHGYGVFALRRIRKGTTITEYLGERISHEEADARYEDKDPDDNHTFLFTVDSKTVIDGGVGGNDARYINHGCDPNCESTTLNKRIYVEAIRTIELGEELAYDYQIERDPEDPPNVDEIFACRCGAAKCRGSMLVARRKPRMKSAAAAGGAGAAKTAGKTSGKTAGKTLSKKGKARKQASAARDTRGGVNARAAVEKAAAMKDGRARGARGKSTVSSKRGRKTRTGSGKFGKGAATNAAARKGSVKKGAGRQEVAKRARKSSRSPRRTTARSTRSGAVG